jgi:hypothetical protein
MGEIFLLLELLGIGGGLSLTTVLIKQQSGLIVGSRHYEKERLRMKHRGLK